jgi:hypothetical protein
MKFESISDLFKSPLSVVNRSGEIEELDLDPSREPRLYIVDDPPLANDVPVADVKCSDGGGATLMFDSWPPQYNNLNVVGYGHIVSNDKFVRRVNALLAAA